MVTGRLVATALLLGATTTAAMAQEEGGLLPGSFTGNVALTNDYVFRGFTQTQEKAAIQGGLDWDTGMGFYLGTWASNIQFGLPGEGSMEWDVYGGYRGAIDKFTYDVGLIGYLYPGTDAGLTYKWWEVSAKVGYDFDFAALSAGVSYTPDYFGGLDNAVYYTGKLAVPVTISGLEGLTIDGTVGLQNMKSPFTDTMDYSIGVAYAMEWFTTEVRYINTDGSAALCRNVCDGRVVVKVSRSF